VSLKDAFLAKGLVSKKDVRRADKEARKRRKHEKGKQRKKKLVQAEAEEERVQSREEANRLRGEARRKREVEQQQRDLEPRIRQIIHSNRIGARGSIVFHHRGWRSSQILRIAVSEDVAKQLRRGAAGVVALDIDTYVVVGKRALVKMQGLDASRIVFWAELDAVDIDLPAALTQLAHDESRQIDFRPRRATAADIEKFRRLAKDC